jgi:hypothetical protein
MSNDTKRSEQDSIEDLLADSVVEDAGADTRIVLQFPSPDFPAPPAFRLQIPEGWLAVPVPEAEMAVRDPVAVDGFHANVIVRVRRAAADESVVDDLLHSVAVGDATDGLEVVSEEVRADLDTPARWVLVRSRGPQGQVLLARHLLIYVPTDGRVANIVTAVGTFPASAAAELGPRIDRIVGSLRLATPDADGSA